MEERIKKFYIFALKDELKDLKVAATRLDLGRVIFEDQLGQQYATGYIADAEVSEMLLDYIKFVDELLFHLSGENKPFPQEFEAYVLYEEKKKSLLDES